MVVECLKCGSSNVILNTKVSNVKFQFDEKGNIIIFSDVEDKIYWGVVYEGVPAKCKCHNCGHSFSYKEWDNFVCNQLNIEG